MFPEPVRAQIESELDHAQAARAVGFEGRARVCARRAAGAAVRAYFASKNVPVVPSSAYDLLQLLGSQVPLPQDIQQVVEHLVTRVNEDYQLQGSIDLIAETRLLVQYLAKESESMEPNSSEIIVYGTSWCGDSRRARAFFDQNKIPYKWIDIDSNPEARKFVESVNRGYRSVPTIILPDGSMLVEPSAARLAEKLGIPQR